MINQYIYLLIVGATLGVVQSVVSWGSRGPPRGRLATRCWLSWCWPTSARHSL